MASSSDDGNNRFLTMYRTVAKKKARASSIRSLSVHSRRLYLVSSLWEPWMCPDMLLSSSSVSPTTLDDDTATVSHHNTCVTDSEHTYYSVSQKK